MDSWNEKELKMMDISGNSSLLKFFKEFGLENNTIERYTSNAAEYYR